MDDRATERTRQQLRHAEARLAEAERAMLNPSAMSDGNSWGATDSRKVAQEMNERIGAAHGIDSLRAEIARLEAIVGPTPPQPTLLDRVLRRLGR